MITSMFIPPVPDAGTVRGVKFIARYASWADSERFGRAGSRRADRCLRDDGSSPCYFRRGVSRRSRRCISTTCRVPSG